MTATLHDDAAIFALTEKVSDLVDVVGRQVDSLGLATDTMRRHRRNTWLALAAVVAVVVMLGAVGWREIAYRDAQRTASCERGNAIKEAVVRAAGVAVEETALELAGDDPADVAQARRVATTVTARVAADEGLALRECG